MLKKNKLYKDADYKYEVEHKIDYLKYAEDSEEKDGDNGILLKNATGTSHIRKHKLTTSETTVRKISGLPENYPTN